MIVYKPTYTRPLPKGAKILKRKDGKYAVFKSKGRTVTVQLSKDGKKIRLETTHYWISFTDNDFVLRKLKAYTDKRACEKLADRIDDLLNCKANNQPPDAELQEWFRTIPSYIRDKLIDFGLVVGCLGVTSKPLTEHINDFAETLYAKGNKPTHVIQTQKRVAYLFKRCDFRYYSDISASKVQRVLLQMRKENGFGDQTFNYYLQAVKQFCRWMVEDRRVGGTSPLEYLKKIPHPIQRKKRRALEAHEVERLLQATISGPEHHNMTGGQRAMLYQLAIETGLRSSELRSLTVSSFDFEGCTVTIDASYAKNKKTATLPLKPATAAAIEDFIAGKAPADKLFGMPNQPARMLKKDLAAAGIAYRDNSGRDVDFHSLRHTFITSLARAGVHPSTAQWLARHSTITLTMNHYTHRLQQREVDAINALPDYTKQVNSMKDQTALKAG